MYTVSNAAFDALVFLAPMLPAAVGGLATELAGTLNIALEGLILTGAFVYVAAASVAGPIAGAFIALAVTAAVSYGMDGISRKAKADSFVVGLGINMLAPALASILSQVFFGTKGVVVVPGLQSSRVLESLSSTSFVGPVFGHRLSDYLAILVAMVIGVALAYTPFGLRARAAGQNPEALRMAGLDAGRLRGIAFLVSGVACGASGAALAASLGAYVPNMSAGRGWIALVAIYLGGKDLVGTVVASAFFALLLSVASGAQSLSVAPPELLMALPYFVTAIVVIAGSYGALRRRH
ncbi:MAG TPA: ABC transporter permease [bacterium]|nr:ABC transporter permease [bacterium]